MNGRGPSWIPDRYRDLRSMLRGSRIDMDVSEEIENHIAMLTEANMANGMSRDEARRAAERRFGDIEHYRRVTSSIDEQGARGERRMHIRDALRRETSQAIRSIARARSFSLIAALTLALGIGATTAIFTVLDAVALRPLPYPESERLVRIRHPVPGLAADAEWQLSRVGYFHLEEESRSLEHLGVFVPNTTTIAGDGSAERVPSVLASASLFQVLGARPARGRLLQDRDNLPGAPSVAVLDYGFWQLRYGGDADVIGRTVLLDGRSVEVVGVAAPGFTLPGRDVDIWRPLTLDRSAPPVNEHYLDAYGRLRPAVSLAAARADLAQAVNRLGDRFPRVYSEDFVQGYGFGVSVTPLRDDVVGQLARVLWILLGSVGLVLLIACANVANLFIVRLEGRRREIAVRTALGAERSHLVWHYLTESLLLALMGGVLGVALAWAGIQLLLALAPADLPRLNEVHLGWRSIAFALAVSTGAGLVLGLLPLAHAGTSLAALREGSRGLTSSTRQRATRGALVVGQIALAVILLAAAGLMVRSFRQLRSVDPGFDSSGVLTLQLALPAVGYGTYESTTAFWRELSDRVGRLPGVQRAGVTTALPFASDPFCALVFARDRLSDPNWGAPCVPVLLASPGLLEALGVRVDGRTPTWQDLESRTGALVVTRALAQRLWPGEEAIGKLVKGNDPDEPFYEVVGVTGDIRHAALDRPPIEAVYFPLAPIEGAPLWGAPHGATLVVRSSSARPEQLTMSIRRIVSEMNPLVAVANVRTMDDVVARSMASTSFTMVLLATAAAMAMLLSAVGIYGVLSYLVAQRRGEIGIRMALGAGASQVARLVVGHSVRLAAIGTVIGLLGALAVTGVMRSLLFEVSPTDPVTLVAVSAGLIAVALVASYAPARRATGVDPAQVLKGE